MLGYLIPCDGGPPIGLSKAKLKLKLRSNSVPAPETIVESPAELHFADGRWSVVTPPDGPRLQINDRPCEAGRLLPDDVLTVGRHRYRIRYRAPETGVETPATACPSTPESVAPASQPSVQPAPRPAPRPVDSAVLGMLIPCAGGRAVMLRKIKVVIGRAANCDVVILNKVVSGRHCELEYLRGYWQAADLDSRNGMFVDGMGYRTKWLFPGNILGVATQRFRVEYVATGDRPSAAEDDVPVLSRKSLMERAGLSDDKLESLLHGKDQEEPVRKRWQIDDACSARDGK